MKPNWPTLRDAELSYMAKVLDHTRGDVTRAARILGLPLETLLRVMSGEPSPDLDELGEAGELKKYLFVA